MRAHRRTIPPVNAPAAESLGASRFSAADEPASPVQAMNPDLAASATKGPSTIRAFSFERNALERHVPPAVTAPENQPQPRSILGKLFKPQAEPAANARADSLHAMFERLRQVGRPANELTNTQASAGHASRAGRLPRL
jgi:hypothetical protein